MTEKPTFEELSNRIRADIKHFGGELPERYSIAWGGYIAALTEWDLISVGDHKRLCELMPKIDNDPVIDIALGRPDETLDQDP